MRRFLAKHPAATTGTLSCFDRLLFKVGTGGFVYRGCAMPDLHGTYFYPDYCAGFVRTFRYGPGGVVVDSQDRTLDLVPGDGHTIDNPTSFGEDVRGELYIVDYDGELYRIRPGG